MDGLDFFENSDLFEDTHMLDEVLRTVRTDFYLIAAVFAALAVARILLGIAVLNDARSRGISSPTVYAIVTAAGGFIPALVYLCVRNKAVDIGAQNYNSRAQHSRSVFFTFFSIALWLVAVAYGYTIFRGMFSDIKSAISSTSDEGFFKTVFDAIKGAIPGFVSGETSISDLKISTVESGKLAKLSFLLKVFANAALAFCLQRDATSQNRKHRISLVICTVLFGWLSGIFYMCVRHNRRARFVCGNCGAPVEGGPLSVCGKCGGMLPIEGNVHSLEAQEMRKQTSILAVIYFAAKILATGASVASWYFLFEQIAKMLDRVF